jgi:hypothetical protein
VWRCSLTHTMCSRGAVVAIAAWGGVVALLMGTYVKESTEPRADAQAAPHHGLVSLHRRDHGVHQLCRARRHHTGQRQIHCTR